MCSDVSALVSVAPTVGVVPIVEVAPTGVVVVTPPVVAVVVMCSDVSVFGVDPDPVVSIVAVVSVVVEAGAEEVVE